MSGYVEAGYTVALSVLGAYGLSVGLRERAARRRICRGGPATGRGYVVAGGEDDGPVTAATDGRPDEAR